MMVRKGHTFYLHPEDPREAALDAMLRDLAASGRKSEWIVSSLILVHQGTYAGLHGVHQKLDEALELLRLAMNDGEVCQN